MKTPTLLTTTCPGFCKAYCYSAPLQLQSPASQRYRDLLIAEHLALQHLAEQGIAAAESSLLRGGRLYLQIHRFDRIGKRGRRGIVSLREVEAEYVGAAEHWHEAADALYKLGLIDGNTRQRIHVLYAFGVWIGNTDMHFGNLAFFLENFHLQGLAPVYDMLPMMYLPVHDEVPRRDFQPRPLLGVDNNLQQQARQMAQAYWRRVMGNEHISVAFRQIAQANLTTLENSIL